jgi:hypothetical protein
MNLGEHYNLANRCKCRSLDTVCGTHCRQWNTLLKEWLALSELQPKYNWLLSQFVTSYLPMILSSWLSLCFCLWEWQDHISILCFLNECHDKAAALLHLFRKAQGNLQLPYLQKVCGVIYQDWLSRMCPSAVQAFTKC